MRTEYDFSDSVKNPYIKKLDKQVTVELDDNTLAYFQQVSEQSGIPYQSLIALYLRDCALQHRQLSIKWLEADLIAK
jgi:predicted DNA binding CopG/RHH family protein